MIVIKLGGIALVCVVHAMILDIPVKDQKVVKEALTISLKRQNRLKFDPEMQEEHEAYAGLVYDEEFNRRYKQAYKELEAQYEGWVTMDKLLEEKK